MLRRHFHEGREAAERRGLAAAAAGGIPVTPRMPTPDGRDVVDDGAGGRWSLYEWAPGVHVARDAVRPVHAAALGRMAARIHDAFRSAPVSDEERPVLPHHRTEDTLAAIAGLVEVVRSEPVQGADERAALRWLSAQAASLEAGEDGVAPGPLPPDAVQLIHGDYHEGNVFFDDDDEVVAVIDWDRCRPWWPALEVMRCFGLSFHLDPSLVTAFLEGYRSLRPLPLEDLDAAAAMYGYQRAHDLWFFQALYVEGNARLRASVNPDTYVSFARSWRDLSRRAGR